MDNEFKWFLRTFGPPKHSFPVDHRTLCNFKGKLPNRLLAYWESYGFCAFGNGLLWLVNPEDYEPALKEWLEDTPAAHEDVFYVIARSGFGSLFLWGEKTGYRYEIDCPRGWIVQQDGNSAAIAEGRADLALARFFAIRRRDHVDINDSRGEGLFDRLVKKHGALSRDEVFAFEPSLMIGGSRTIENGAKRNVYVHLSVLAQLGHRELLDSNGLARKAFG
jgi:hypothetical protein